MERVIAKIAKKDGDFWAVFSVEDGTKMGLVEGDLVEMNAGQDGKAVILTKILPPNLASDG